MTLTNHRPFQNRPTLDAKKMYFCSSESHERRMFGISALKTIVLKNKTKLFFRPAIGQLNDKPVQLSSSEEAAMGQVASKGQNYVFLENGPWYL